MTKVGQETPPRLVAWETTAACNLACRHCRAEAVPSSLPGELNSVESENFIRSLASWDPKPMIILSGGEPLTRPDILDLATLGSSLGFRMLLSTNGTLLTTALAKKIKKAKVARLSLSLDGPTAKEHDNFRGVKGAFTGLMEGAAILRAEGLPFQINTTITPDNIDQIAAISVIAEEIGAVAHHVFLLVPVGRALEMEAGRATPEDYEAALIALKTREPFLKLEFKATCAPQYNRIGRQLKAPLAGQGGRGCLGGQGFMFVSYDGRVQACGYLPITAGNIRKANPIDIYDNSPLFQNLRRRESYQGKCRDCEYWSVCGGCRARAHAVGDYLGPEPLCPYVPQVRRA